MKLIKSDIRELYNSYTMLLASEALQWYQFTVEIENIEKEYASKRNNLNIKQLSKIFQKTNEALENFCKNDSLLREWTKKAID